MVPIVTRLASDFSGRALVGTVDAGQQSDLSRTYGVSAVPTFIYFKGGQEVSRQLGTTTYEDLAARLDALVKAP